MRLLAYIRKMHIYQVVPSVPLCVCDRPKRQTHNGRATYFLVFLISSRKYVL